MNKVDNVERIWRSKVINGKSKLLLEEKECSRCGEVKSIKCFDKRKGSKDGFFKICRSCNPNYANYKREHNGISYKEFKQRNKISKNRKSKRGSKKGCIKNPEYRIKKSVSARYGKTLCFPKNKGKNGTTMNEELGYSITELKEHLESQFTDKMNWNNYCKYWEIDHINPLDNFKDKQSKEAWDLSNLQPLTCYENNKKNNSPLN